MFGLLLGIIAHIHYSLRGIMPTNILLDALHTRRGLKWGVPAMLLTVPYAAAAAYCTGQAETGGPGWLHLLALLFAWNALKFLVSGPVSLLRLLWALGREAYARRLAARTTLSEEVDAERFDAGRMRRGVAERAPVSSQRETW